jgi:hypothetical protein
MGKLFFGRDCDEARRIRCAYYQGFYDAMFIAVVFFAAALVLTGVVYWMVRHG